MVYQQMLEKKKADYTAFETAKTTYNTNKDTYNTKVDEEAAR